MTARLRDAVDRLTRDRPETIQTDTGTRYVQSTALLTQLRQSYLDTNGSGGAGETHGKLPISVPATDLLNRIDSEVTQALAECTLRPRKGTTEEKVRRYGAAILAFGAGEIARAELVVSGWVGSIEGLLHPVRKRRPLGQPCPACSNMWVLGENGRIPAVTIAFDWSTHYTTWDANCLACNAAWTGEELAYLLRAGDAA